MLSLGVWGGSHNLADKLFTSRFAKGEDKQLTSIARLDFVSSMTEAVMSEVYKRLTQQGLVGSDQRHTTARITR